MTYAPQYYQNAYAPQYYQAANAQPVYQAPEQAQAAPVQPVYQATYQTQAAQTASNPQVVTASYTAPSNTATDATQQVAAPAGDPYGFTAWLNSTRAAYGLPPVGYDPNLSSWAAMNNNAQTSYGMGHHVMGPARRQNSAMGAFPGVESMWMASPAHSSALLDPTIRWIGIAGLGAYWTFNAN